MKTRTFGRLGAAAVVAFGLLLATAVPASAVDATGVVIDASSTVTIGTTLTTHIKGHATDNVCAPNSEAPTAIPVTFDSSGNGTISGSTTGWGDFVAGTNTFKVRLIIVSGTISITTTGVTVNLTLRAEFRTCNSVDSLCTTNPITITLTGATTVSHHPMESESQSVSGTTTTHITVPPSCNNVIRNVLVSHTVSADLDLHAVDIP